MKNLRLPNRNCWQADHRKLFRRLDLVRAIRHHRRPGDEQPNGKEMPTMTGKVEDQNGEPTVCFPGDFSKISKISNSEERIKL